MKRNLLGAVAAATVLAGSAGVMHADVKTDEKSQVKFEGMLGRMMGIFGGKAMKEGMVNTVAVKGDRKATFNEYTGEIVDLSEEKVYRLDMRKKEYEVQTFAEMRREMEEARRKAEENARRSAPPEKKDDAPATRDPNQKEVEVDFDLKETGQKKPINGFDTREVVMTIAVREKGKTLEQSGGLVLTADTWLGPKVEATKEVAAFDQRYYEKLNGPMMIGDVETMAAAAAMYPGLQAAMARFRAENVNMEGHPILTAVTIEGVKNPEQVAEEKERGGSPATIGGMLGGLGRLRKKKEDAPAAGASAGAANRTKIMTMTSEVLKIATSVGPADVAVPAGFKQK